MPIRTSLTAIFFVFLVGCSSAPPSSSIKKSARSFPIYDLTQYDSQHVQHKLVGVSKRKWGKRKEVPDYLDYKIYLTIGHTYENRRFVPHVTDEYVYLKDCENAIETSIYRKSKHKITGKMTAPVPRAFKSTYKKAPNGRCYTKQRIYTRTYHKYYDLNQYFVYEAKGDSRGSVNILKETNERISSYGKSSSMSIGDALLLGGLASIFNKNNYGGAVEAKKIKTSKNYKDIKKSGKFYTFTCEKGAKQKVYVKDGNWHTSIWSTRTPALSFTDSRLKASKYTIHEFATRQCNY